MASRLCGLFLQGFLSPELVALDEGEAIRSRDREKEHLQRGADQHRPGDDVHRQGDDPYGHHRRETEEENCRGQHGISRLSCAGTPGRNGGQEQREMIDAARQHDIAQDSRKSRDSGEKRGRRESGQDIPDEPDDPIGPRRQRREIQQCAGILRESRTGDGEGEGGPGFHPGRTQRNTDVVDSSNGEKGEDRKRREAEEILARLGKAKTQPEHGIVKDQAAEHSVVSAEGQEIVRDGCVERLESRPPRGTQPDNIVVLESQVRG